MPRRINRRRFLQVSVGAAVAGAALSAGLGMPGARAKPKPSARRVLAKEIHLGPREMAEASRVGLTAAPTGIRVESARSKGQFLSPVFESDMMFDYVGLFWSGFYPEGSSVTFWVRTSADGGRWSPWETVQVEMQPGPRAQYDTYGALVRAHRAKYVQFLGELQGSGNKPALNRMGLILLNPYDGPILEAAAETGDGGLADSALAAEADWQQEAAVAPAAASGKPITFKREDWGADESLRFDGGEEIWPRAHVPTKKLIVHHTATWNGYGSVEEAKAQIRAIYTYHAKSLGWGDIGYNCLIDKFGNSYEGRRGRDGPGYDGPGGREILSEDVTGGHALAYNYGSSGIALLGTFCTPSECPGGSPSSAMISRLKDVLEWECRQHGIDPQADSDFLLHDGTWHRDLHNVPGHRDVGVTTCPGGNVYALLPQVRSDVAARLGSTGPSVSITSAPPEGTVNSGEVEYAWTGSGGSGGLQYSYCLVGWSHISATGDVNYLRGFDSRKSPYWSEWTGDTQAKLCYVPEGIYTFHVRVKDSSGRVGVYQDSRTFQGTAQTGACDGALLQGSDATIYVMRRGLKRRIPNSTTLEATGYLWGNVNRVPDSYLDDIPTGDPLLDAEADGNLLSATGRGVYVMEGGLKRHIINTVVFSACGYGWDAVQGVSVGRLDAIAEGPDVTGPPCPHLVPPDGTLVASPGGGVHVMQRGLKRLIPNVITFEAGGFQWGNVNGLPESVMDAIPTGDPLLNVMADGNLLTATGRGVYVMENGLKRHIINTVVFSACGYGWDAVQGVSVGRLDAIAEGPDVTGPPCPHLVPPDGTLVASPGGGVHVMQQGLKRLIPNVITFEAGGYQWGNVNGLPQSVMDAIPTGDPLLDVMADGNLLTATGRGVYVMENGLKRHIINTVVFSACGYGWDAVQGVSVGRLDAIPEGADVTGPPCPHLVPPDGMLVQGSAAAIYIMEGGLKRRIIDPGVFTACGYLSGNVNLIADSSLAAIPAGADLTGSPCP